MPGRHVHDGRGEAEEPVFQLHARQGLLRRNYRISKTEYFGSRADKPRKTLVLSGYVRQGRSWQPSRSVMTNHETETSTQIVWSSYQIDTPIDERIMSPSAIGR